ncbi:MAG: homoserine dehydrogenase [Pseudomonadota bacterium]
MSQSLRLGIAGLGTVGAALIKLITENGGRMAAQTGRSVVVTAVSARSRETDRGFSIEPYVWFDDPVDLAISQDVDVFVELIGGDDGPALASVEAALKAGKPVVTANKALLAKHGHALALLAEKTGAALNYEAAVAGGIPIIKTLRENLSGNAVSGVYGIMNGTCNYILTRMEAEKISFDDCLKDAQRLGYAEADPTFDIGGHDTAHKLAILTSLAFGTEISFESIYMEGISDIALSDIEAADALGFRIKLLGVAHKTETGIEQRVHPAMVPKSSMIARIDGVTNAVAVEADRVGALLLSGPGAGGDATASAVAADIADIARGMMMPVFGKPATMLAPYERARMRLHEGGYYIALHLLDRPGAFASIATEMARCDISLQSVVQHRRSTDASSGGDAVAQPVVIITHETTEKAVKQALEAIVDGGSVVGKPKMIRIENLD